MSKIRPTELTAPINIVLSSLNGSAADNAGEHVINCWGALAPGDGRREGEKGALEGEGPFGVVGGIGLWARVIGS